VAFADLFPLTEGHTLIVPRRHEERLSGLNPKEWHALWDLAHAVQEHLVEEHSPDGFSIGVNDGIAAGQTVRHAHIHVIPRHKGDVPDPRGGVRWVIPGKARWW
jgi:diadenosine tetraphosphate (Ap4A) HIT family hydrolase